MTPSPTSNAWKEAIEYLIKYSKQRGWSVEFSKEKDDESVPNKGKIILNSRHKPEILYYFFLHEIGHILLYQTQDYRTKYRIFWERSQWSLTYRVTLIEEEIEAWNLGNSLAKRLNLPINRNKYEELKASMISSYALWANQRKHPHLMHSRYYKKKLMASIQKEHLDSRQPQIETEIIIPENNQENNDNFNKNELEIENNSINS